MPPSADSEEHEPPLVAGPYQFGCEFAFLDLITELNAALQGVQERGLDAFLFSVALHGDGHEQQVPVFANERLDLGDRLTSIRF